MESIQVYFLQLDDRSPAELNHILPYLNDVENKRAAAFYHRADAYRFLAGRWLLKHWLYKNGTPPALLASITYDDYKRPLLAGVSFSITHAGNWVGIAIAKGNIRLGLDIEEKKTIQVNEYLSVFTAQEQQYIQQADSINRFYQLWTRKEAVLKALGQGFLMEPTAVNVLGNDIIVAGTPLQVSELSLPSNMAVHIAGEMLAGNQPEIIFLEV